MENLSLRPHREGRLSPVGPETRGREGVGKEGREGESTRNLVCLPGCLWGLQLQACYSLCPLGVLKSLLTSVLGAA